MAKKLVRFDWAMKGLLRNKANFDILEGFFSELLNTQTKIMMRLFYSLPFLSLLLQPQLHAQAGENFKIFSASAGREISWTELVASAGQAQVLFFGEQHDDDLAHHLQDSLYTALLNARGAVTLSLEMFETDVQLVVDEYLQGYITEDRLITEGRAWKNYANHYRSMVETARERRQAVVAANAPRRYVNLVSRKGLASLAELPKSSRAWLPPLPIYVGDTAYLARFREIMGGGHGMDMERIFQAQCLWDASMAYRIFQRWKLDKSGLILHLNGRFHTDYQGGTFAQLKRLNPRLRIMNISCFPVADMESINWAEYAGIGDFVIIHSK